MFPDGLLPFIAIPIRRKMTHDIELVFRDSGKSRIISIKNNTSEVEILRKIDSALYNNLPIKSELIQKTPHHFEKYLPESSYLPALHDYFAKEGRFSHVESWSMQKDAGIELKRRHNGGSIHVVDKRITKGNLGTGDNASERMQKHDIGISVDGGFILDDH
jgi:hypothetical protein